MPQKNSQRMQEMLTGYDENMNEIGDFTRSYVHNRKIWHKVVQCWIVCRTETGIRVYLQRRSFEKKSHPGRYDITAGGHVSAGETPKQAVVRETLEETGVVLNPTRLHELGYVKEAVRRDREIAYIYVYEQKDPPFRPGDEVIYMVSADLDDFYALATRKKEEITVIPAIRTGLLYEEAFPIKLKNCTMHESFTKMVYPYVKNKIGGQTRKDGGMRKRW